jgi:hypothetical protein
MGSADKRRTATRREITKALREMQRKGLPINPHALAKYAGVARKSIYNHETSVTPLQTTTPRGAASAASALKQKSGSAKGLERTQHTFTLFTADGRW